MCPVSEATVFLVQERTKCAPVKVVKVRLQKADLGNYIVKKLSQYSDHNDDISVNLFFLFTIYEVFLLVIHSS